MKKLMILGAGIYQVPLIKKAREMGLYSIVVSPEGNYPGFKYADKVYFEDVRNYKSILKAAELEKINGIVTDQTDMTVITVAYVAQKLNLSGNDFDCAQIFCDKYKMRENLKKAGIKTLNYQLVSNIKQAKDFLNDLNCSAVIKPLDNQGSRGIYKINDEKELIQVFEETKYFSSNKEILIEEFAEGQEVVVESLVQNYDYQNLIIGDTYYFDLSNKFIPKQRLFPSILESKIKNKVLETDKNIITGFGLKQGITHSEYIIDNKTDNIYLIETAARGGGVFISSDIISIMTNLKVEEFLIKTALSEVVIVDFNNKQQKSAGYIAFYFPHGKIIQIQGLEKINSMEGVHKHLLAEIKEGKPVGSITDKTSRQAIILKSENRDNLDKLIREVKNNLIIKIKTDEKIENIIWD